MLIAEESPIELLIGNLKEPVPAHFSPRPSQVHDRVGSSTLHNFV